MIRKAVWIFLLNLIVLTFVIRCFRYSYKNTPTKSVIVYYAAISLPLLASLCLFIGDIIENMLH